MTKLAISSAKRLSPEKRLKQLLEVATHIAKRSHYLTVTHASIANVVQCSVPTVFSYFKTKEQLTEGICKFALEHNNESIIAQIVVSNHPDVSHLMCTITEK
ncbi:TetR/AcrR family transcriptional regulator [Photobacterium leiognathi]|uniref:TetR/AcrR family transcriptional regulator n=1 Tax=Photobacterium leiognathi TaxID=553611 RepID=UPI001EDE77F6|nr:TetR/AcrR family transcriptional regulator [Photobacterium leiognathi]MCG3883944.1 TetR/AcrR family transcriptional regulator [Photobacterium leiognathi]